MRTKELSRSVKDPSLMSRTHVLKTEVKGGGMHLYPSTEAAEKGIPGAH